MNKESVIREARCLLSAGLLMATMVTAAGNVAAQGSSESSAIDPHAQNILKQMGDFLAATKEFSFKAEVTTDEVAVGIHKIQLTDKIEAIVRRPNKLWVTESGDFMNKRFWYDGRTVSLLSLVDLFYATSKVPNKIDEALDDMMDRYGVTTPIVDFLVSNPYESLMENVTGAMYIGLHDVGGVYCHHLAFAQDDLDWQIWIESGKRLVPRKFVVTYKNDPGSPTVVTVFKSWDFSTKHSDRLFEFKPPDNARKIDFLPLTEM